MRYRFFSLFAIVFIFCGFVLSQGVYALNLDTPESGKPGLDGNRNFIFNLGGLSIGTSTKTANVLLLGSGGFKFSDGTTQTTAYLGSSQTVSAGNVSQGVFGYPTASNAYAFPAALAVGTTTYAGLPTNGLYVAGSVGIGTMPGYTLDVNGTFRAASVAHIDSTSYFGNTLYFGGDGSQGIVSWGGSPVGLVLQAGAGKVLHLRANDSGSDHITIATSSNVGIGTTGPLSKLEVEGDIRFGSVGGKIYGRHDVGAYIEPYNSTTGDMTFYSTFATAGFNFNTANNATAKVRIDYLGNVGIGTTTPSQKLHVLGTIQTGGIGVDGNIYLGRSTDGNTNGRIYSSGASSLIFSQSGGLSSNLIMGSNGIEFQTEDSASPYNKVTRMTIRHGDAGNVGIGTTSPSAKVEIYDVNGWSPENSNVTPLGGLSIKNSASTALVMGIQQGTPYEGWIQVRHGTSAGATYPLSLQPMGGNVGIGTTTPASALHVIGTVTASAFSGGTYAGTISAANVSNGTFGANTGSGVYTFPNTIHAGAGGSWVGFAGYSSSGWGDVGSNLSSDGSNNMVYWQTNAASGFNFSGSNITAWVAPSGTAGTVIPKTTAFSINSSGQTIFSQNAYFPGSGVWNTSGNVGIGTTSPAQQLSIYNSVGGTYWNEGIRVSRGAVPTQYGIINYYGGALRLLAVNEGASAGWTYFDRHNAGSGTPSTSMVIDNLGNVGIGTTAPAAKFVVDSGTARPAIFTGTGGNTYTEFSTTGAGANKFYLYPYADGNTYFQHDGKIIFSAISSTGPQLVVDAVGNVGIGTTTPATALHVIGTVTASAFSGGTYAGTIGAANVSSGAFGSNTGGGVYSFFGNVGIGTTTPSAKLDVWDSAGQGIRSIRQSGGADTRLLGDVAVGYVGTFSNHPLYLTTNSSQRMIIDTTGNVGIGTAAPTYHLESRGGSAGGNVALFEGNNLSDGTGASFAMSGGSYNGMFSVKNSTGAYDAGINLIQDGISSDRRYSIVNQASSGSLLINTDTTNAFGGLAGTNLVTIQNGGNVGIGTTAPGAKLDVTSGHIKLSDNYGIIWDTSGHNGIYGNSASNYISFLTNNVDTMRIVSGNVGIGTTSPGDKLDVNGNVILESNGSPDRFVYTGNNSGTVGMIAGATPIASATYGANFILRGNTFTTNSNQRGNVYIIAGNPTTPGAAEGAINFLTGSNVNRLLIDNSGNFNINSGQVYIQQSSGNVGIGTTSPQGKLHVKQTMGTANIVLETNSTTSVAGDDLGQIDWYNPSSGGNVRARILGETDGVWSGGTNFPTRLSFWTNNNGTTFAERMRIDKDGNVGIGTTTPASALHVVGTVTASAFSGGTYAGTIGAANVSSGAFGSNTGGGVYSFPGNVGIGTTTPANRFHIYETGTSAEGRIESTFAAGAARFRFINNAGGNWYVGAGAFDGSSNFQIATGGASTGINILTNGNVGIGTTTPREKLDVLGQVVGGFGAVSTGGTLDWNDSSNARPGNGYSLLLGSATNGPDGTGEYYHPFSFEYASKTGSGNLTQMAIPYTGGSFNWRTRYSGAWGSWRKFWDNGNDGSGSGLDADLLDGHDTSYFQTAGSISGTTSYIPKFTAASTIGNSIIYDNGTNIGIGTSTPAYFLDLYKSQNAGTSFRVGNGNTGTGSFSNFMLTNDGSNALYTFMFGTNYSSAQARYMADSGVVDSQGTNGLNIAASNAVGIIRFYTNANNERMRIDSSGRIGINVAPSFRFDIADATANGRGLNISQTSASGTNYGLVSQATGASTLNVGGYFLATGATSNYGVYINGPSSGSNNYAIYSPATAQSYFAGSIGVGTTNPNGYKVNIAGTLYVSEGTGASDIVTDKIDANTVDPVYTIGGKKYATYLPSMTGVKEETTGVAKLRLNNSRYEYIVDFDTSKMSSDLWLFAKATNLENEGLSNLVVLLTPNFDGKTWYQKNKKSIVIYAELSDKQNKNCEAENKNCLVEVSYRLTAPRFDHNEWSNIASTTWEGLNLDKYLSQ